MCEASARILEQWTPGRVLRNTGGGVHCGRRHDMHICIQVKAEGTGTGLRAGRFDARPRKEHLMLPPNVRCAKACVSMQQIAVCSPSVLQRAAARLSMQESVVQRGELQKNARPWIADQGGLPRAERLTRTDGQANIAGARGTNELLAHAPISSSRETCAWCVIDCFDSN